MNQRNVRLLLSSIVGGAVFFCYTLFAYVVLPFHGRSFSSFQNEQKVATVLKENAPTHGMYIIPAWDSGGKQEAIKGLMMFAVLRPVTPTPEPVMLLRGLLLYMLTAFLFSALLLLTRGLGFMGRVGFILLMTLTVFVTAYLSLWNWWHFTTWFAIVEFFDLAVGWFSAGLAMSAILGPAYGDKNPKRPAVLQ